MAANSVQSRNVIPMGGGLVDIDKMAHYGEFIHSQRNAQWRETLAEKATHKALDIAMDPPDLGINTDNRQTNVNGLDWKGIAVAGGLGLAGLLGFAQVMKPQPVAPPPVVQPAPVDTDTDTDSSVKLQWGN